MLNDTENQPKYQGITLVIITVFPSPAQCARHCLTCSTNLLRLLSLLRDLLWSRDLLHLRSEVRLEWRLRERLLFLLSLSRALSFSLSSSSLRLFLSLSSLSLSRSFSLSSRSCFSFFKRSSRSGSSVLFLNFS